MIKVDGYITFGAIICVAIGLITAEKGKPFGFIMATIGFWLAGLAMINAMYFPDEQGVSRVRRGNNFMQFSYSLFYCLWFGFLAFFSYMLYGVATK